MTSCTSSARHAQYVLVVILKVRETDSRKTAKEDNLIKPFRGTAPIA